MLKAVPSCRKYATNSKSLPTEISVIPRPFRRQCSPELANLAPLPAGSKKAISLKRTEPASASNVVFSKQTSRYTALDPNHWFFNTPKPYRYPSTHTDLFSAKIIPNGLLSHVDADSLPPFEDKVPSSSPLMSKYGSSHQGKLIRHRADYERDEVLLACVMIICGQSAVHKSAVIRKRTKMRIIEALKLIVIRGAKASEDGQKVEFAAEEAHGSNDKKEWLLKDWTYVLYANLKAYRAPWPILVTALRDMLDTLAQKSTENAKYGVKPARKGSNPDTRSQASRSPARILVPEQDQDLRQGKAQIRGQAQSGAQVEAQTQTSKSGQSHPRDRYDSPKQRAPKPGHNPMVPSRRPFSTISPSSAPSPVRSSSSPTSNDSYTNPRPNSYRRRESGANSQSHFERRDIRAEVILGSFHENSLEEVLAKDEMWPKECVTVELEGAERTLGINLSSRIEKHMKRLRPLQLKQPVEWRLWAGQDSEDLYSLSEYDFDAQDKSHDQQEAQAISGAPFDELAEGWVLVPIKGRRYPTYISTLLDTKTVLRFLHPNIPHHAGRGYERNLRTNWVNKDANFLRHQFSEAIKERRWRRMVLNASWNIGDYSDAIQGENGDHDGGREIRPKNRTTAKYREERKKRRKGNGTHLDWLMELKKKEEARQQLVFEKENDLTGAGNGDSDPVTDNALLDKRMPWWTPSWHQTYRSSDYSKTQTRRPDRQSSNYDDTTSQEYGKEDAGTEEPNREPADEHDGQYRDGRQRRKWSERLREYDETGI